MPTMHRPAGSPLLHDDEMQLAVDAWAQIGTDIALWVEPFGAFGYLARPPSALHVPAVLGDQEGAIANFLRAMRADPVAVAQAMPDKPVGRAVLRSEIIASNLLERLELSIGWSDARLAGMWGQLACQTIGKRHVTRDELGARVAASVRVADLLSETWITCSGAQRTLRFASAWKRKHAPDETAGVLIAPPDPGDSTAALDWCIKHGSDPLWRIVVIAQDDANETLDRHGWRRLSATAAWSSPTCERAVQTTLFGCA